MLSMRMPKNTKLPDAADEFQCGEDIILQDIPL